MTIKPIEKLEGVLHKTRGKDFNNYTQNNVNIPQDKTENQENVANVTPIKKKTAQTAHLKKRADIFRFNNIIDEISDIIYNHSEASYTQIHLKVIQNLAFLFSYGGIHKFKNLGFYGYDFSPTGSGKSDVIKHAKRLLLRPVIQKVEKLHQEELQRAEEEKREPTLYRVVNTTQMSPEALFEAFQNVPVQMVESEEFGKYLKQNAPLIEYIISLYGKDEISIPSYKNKKTITRHSIDKIDFFFYGASTLRYLGLDKFYSELQGGLLNRGVIVYNPDMREFEEKPREYKLKDKDVVTYNAVAKEIIEFANVPEFHISSAYKDNRAYVAFHKDIYERRKELNLINNPFADLYARVMQNFDSILLTMVLLEFFQRGYYINEISDSIIEKTVEYFKTIMDNNDELIEYILNYKDKQNDELTFKIVNKAKELITQNGHCTLRELYKPLKVKKDKVLYILKEYNQNNGEFLIQEQGKSVIITLC